MILFWTMVFLGSVNFFLPKSDNINCWAILLTDYKRGKMTCSISEGTPKMWIITLHHLTHYARPVQPFLTENHIDKWGKLWGPYYIITESM